MTIPDVLIYRSTGQPHNVRPSQVVLCTLRLQYALFFLAVRLVDFRVLDQTRQQVNTVHCWVLGQGASKLHHIFDLQACSEGW